ncbi:MAG: hypothetical protein IKK34_00710 [Clostridia bacterium]|nr:hypothetical protein [Clostridia bacterium]
MFSEFLGRPYRFLIMAGVLAALLCLFPARVEEPQEMKMEEQNVASAQTEIGAAPVETLFPQGTNTPVLPGLPAGADLSERTGSGCYLHRTLYYAPCGHSVQRRDKMPAQLVGLSREALEAQIAGVIPGAAVTGFSASEVDIALSTEIPCPLHWVLRGGEDGMLVVMQNVSGEALEVVRKTEVFTRDAPEDDLAALLQGRMFDDVQALEGYLESLSS